MEDSDATCAGGGGGEVSGGGGGGGRFDEARGRLTGGDEGARLIG